MIIDHKVLNSCWENGIRIYPTPIVGHSDVSIIINYYGKESVGELKYSQSLSKKNNVWEKINELYLELYLKKVVK